MISLQVARHIHVCLVDIDAEMFLYTARLINSVGHLATKVVCIVNTHIAFYYIQYIMWLRCTNFVLFKMLLSEVVM